mgnify:CR=1 FL=1
MRIVFVLLFSLLSLGVCAQAPKHGLPFEKWRQLCHPQNPQEIVATCHLYFASTINGIVTSQKLNTSVGYGTYLCLSALEQKAALTLYNEFVTFLQAHRDPGLLKQQSLGFFVSNWLLSSYPTTRCPG